MLLCILVLAFKQTKLTAPEIEQESPERIQEDRFLKLGYMAMWLERSPFNDDIENCSSPESAYLLWMEKGYGEIPAYLEFGEIESSLMDQDKERIRNIWNLLTRQRVKFLSAVGTIKKHWKAGKKLKADKEAKEIVKNPPVKLRDEFRHAISLVITYVPPEQKGTSNIGTWQTIEKSLRKTVSDEHKKYLLLLRLYYEMLLEKDGNASVLPPDHDLRQEIVERNAAAMGIDSKHRFHSAAKAAHNQQETGTRLRRTAKIPYVYHTMQVSNMAMLDVMPFVMERITEEIRESVHLVTLDAICQTHDMPEDTTLSAEEAVGEFVKRIANTEDSTIDPVIVSGFGRSRSEVKKQMLNLMDERVEEELLQILRIVSNNTRLTPEEQEMAEKQKIRERYKGQQREWQELIEFLVRLNAIPAVKNSSPKIMQTALITKMEDRADNIETKYSLEKLNATTDVLIRYAMTEHDNKNYPLYNATARLIDKTLEKYEELQTQNPDTFKPEDLVLVSQLEQWQKEVKRHKNPKVVEEILVEYERLAA